MKYWFEETFDLYLSEFNNLALDQIDSIEIKEFATDLTQNHEISHFLLENKEVETPRIYRKFESSAIEVKLT